MAEAATLASRPADRLVLPKDMVLLTIDMQQGFDQFPERNNPGAESIVARLQDAWRAAGRPLWHVRHDSTEPKSVFRPGQPGNAFKPETAPRPGEPVFPKSVHSALIGTELEAKLRAAGCKHLIIMGIQTNYCVATTARMASNLGFSTYVVKDACATFPQTMLDGSKVPAQLAHDLALAELHGEFGSVVASGDILKALASSS